MILHLKKKKKTSWRRLEVNLKNYNLKLTEKFWTYGVHFHVQLQFKLFWWKAFQKQELTIKPTLTFPQNLKVAFVKSAL